MWIPLLLSALLAAPAGTAAVPTAPTGATGTIAGRILPSESVRITKPVQVVVFTGRYVNLYLAEVQVRIDNYWEDFKWTFIQEKETFVLFRDRAERQAMEFALDRMRRDDPLLAANFVHTTTNNTFEFRTVPQGECKVVALVTSGEQEFVWSQTVFVRDATPVSVTLKPSNP